MTWGQQLAMLLEMKESGQDPPALRIRPQVTQKQSNFIDIFYELSGSRRYSAGGTPLPIPVSEFNSYFQAFHVTFLPERELILKMVQAADSKYIEIANKQAEEQSKKDK